MRTTLENIYTTKIEKKDFIQSWLIKELIKFDVMKKNVCVEKNNDSKILMYFVKSMDMKNKLI